MPRRARDPDEVRSAIGKRIADARKRAGKTQTQVATEVGVDSQTISKIERGLQTPMGTTLRGLAESLGVSTSWLLEEEGAVSTPVPPVEDKELPRAARQVIDEYLHSSHGRTAPREVQARLRSGAIFTTLGVMAPGWRDVDDLRSILERQLRTGTLGPLLVARDEPARGTKYRRRKSPAESKGKRPRRS